MRTKWLAVLTAAPFLIGSPAFSQISTNAADADMMPHFESANKCLTAFDEKARSKKLSVESYKAALEGACVAEIKDLRGLYSLSLVRSSNHDYLVERLDKNVTDAKAAMVTRYVMR